MKCGVVLSLQNYEEEINKLFSKKMLLSLIAQLYDPIGFFTPLVLNLRNVLSVLHQETKGKLDEDADIPPEYKVKLQWMVKEVLLAATRNFPRTVIPQSETGDRPKAVLVGFCDESTVAYSALTYLVFKMEDGGQTSFTLLPRLWGQEGSPSQGLNSSQLNS